MSRIRRMGGGATVVAHGATPCTDRTVPYLKWYRLYSDRWLEQGSVCSNENILTNLQFPFVNNVYNVQLTDVALPADNTSARWVDMHPEYITYKSFYYRLGLDRTGSGAGQVAYIASGIVSEDTFKNIIAGKEWDPITESFGGEYLVNIESGSRELTLEPGRYKVYMVGKGGNPVAYSDGTGWKGYTGGAGGTLIAEISLADSTAASLNVNDTSRECEFILGGSKLLSAGYGKDGNNGNGYSGSTVGTGGTNTVITDSRISVVSNVNGGDAGGAFQWVSGYEGFKATATIEAADPVGHGHGNSGNWTSTSTSVQPGPALIMLYKFGD